MVEIFEKSQEKNEQKRDKVQKVYENGDEYIGEVNNENLPHGLGKYFFKASGNIYEGIKYFLNVLLNVTKIIYLTYILYTC
jgi:hypothetical protein